MNSKGFKPKTRISAHKDLKLHDRMEIMEREILALRMLVQDCLKEITKFERKLKIKYDGE